MSNVIACQPGWVAVFQQTDGDGYTTEPIAGWLLVEAPHQQPELRPLCPLGSDICDATQVEEYIGVVGPGGDCRKLVEAFRKNKPAA